jgi:hypothetical protein
MVAAATNETVARVVDPDPDWIWIQWICGSGSILGIRIRNQGQENYLRKKILMNNTIIFYLIWLKFWFQKNLRKKLAAKVLF